MQPEDYALQHTDIPQPTLFDGELCDYDWPMPPGNPYAPKAGFWARVCEFFAALRDPFDVEI